MAVPYFLLCIIMSSTVGSELEPSSGPSLLDSIKELRERISNLENSMNLAIREENEKTSTHASDRTAAESEALKKEIRSLLSNLSLRVEQNLSEQSLRIEKLSQQMEEVQSVLTCTGEPPSPENGTTVHFERKHGSAVVYRCDVNFEESENSTVRCHLGKWEGRPPLCTRLSSSALSLRAHLIKDFPQPVANVSCHEVNGHQVRFSRLLDTGTGWALQTDARTFSRDGVAVLDLSGVLNANKRGVFQCGYDNQTRVTFVISPYGEIERPEVVSVGDTTTFTHIFESDAPSYRWLHDGQPVPAWDGRGSVQIVGVVKEDAGFYERYKEGDRRVSQWFFRLVVRDCPAGFFGHRCDQKCTACHHGGLCDEKLGTCLCPAGFGGRQCEEACGRGRIGPDCSEACDGGDCIWQVFCRPDPHGCSCAAGYSGYYCNEPCYTKRFGAKCKLICHCPEGSCDPYTGACSGGCSEGWTGASCQIPVGN